MKYSAHAIIALLTEHFSTSIMHIRYLWSMSIIISKSNMNCGSPCLFCLTKSSKAYHWKLLYRAILHCQQLIRLLKSSSQHSQLCSFIILLPFAFDVSLLRACCRPQEEELDEQDEDIKSAVETSWEQTQTLKSQKQVIEGHGKLQRIHNGSITRP